MPLAWVEEVAQYHVVVRGRSRRSSQRLTLAMRTGCFHALQQDLMRKVLASARAGRLWRESWKGAFALSIRR